MRRYRLPPWLRALVMALWVAGVVILVVAAARAQGVGRTERPCAAAVLPAAVADSG